jgi:hypothetical protein
LELTPNDPDFSRDFTQDFDSPTAGIGDFSADFGPDFIDPAAAQTKDFSDDFSSDWS